MCHTEYFCPINSKEKHIGWAMVKLPFWNIQGHPHWLCIDLYKVELQLLKLHGAFL